MTESGPQERRSLADGDFFWLRIALAVLAGLGLVAMSAIGHPPLILVVPCLAVAVGVLAGMALRCVRQRNWLGLAILAIIPLVSFGVFVLNRQADP